MSNLFHRNTTGSWFISSTHDRHQDIEDPEHPKRLLESRRAAREQRLLMRFLALSPQAQAYYEGLESRRANARHHVRKIVALSEIYGTDAVGRAIADGLAFAAFSCEDIANLLEMRTRSRPEAGALHLTRRQDLLEIEIAAPDLSLYEVKDDDNESAKGHPDPDADVLRAQLAGLQLAFLSDHYEALARQAAEHNWPHVEYLARLIEGEAHRRETRRIQRRIRARHQSP